MLLGRTNGRTKSPPLIPHEVWLHIFELATFVPGILDPDIHDPFESASPLDEALLPYRKDALEISQSLATRRALVGVCKLWRALVSPLLYQAVVIRNVRQLEALHGVLCSTGSHGTTLSSFVRRLDMVDINFVMEPEVLTTLAPLVGCLSRLRVLNLQGELHADNRDVATRLSETLGANCSSTLQKLIWDVDPPPASAAFGALLARFQKLRTCVVGFHDDLADDLCLLDFPALPELRFSTLTHSVLPDSCAVSRHAIASPHLTQALFHEIRDVSEHCVEGFLTATGSSLTTAYFLVYASLASAQCEHLTRFCPRLRHVVLLMADWGWLFQGDEAEGPYFSSITHLGLYSSQVNASRKMYQQVFGWLRFRLPSSVKVVRFLNPDGVAALRRGHFGTLMAALSVLPKGLRVEDHEGNALGIRITSDVVVE